MIRIAILLAAVMASSASGAMAFEIDGYRMGMTWDEAWEHVRQLNGKMSVGEDTQGNAGLAPFDRRAHVFEGDILAIRNFDLVPQKNLYFCGDRLAGVDRNVQIGYPAFARIVEREQARYGNAEASIKNEESGVFGESYTMTLTWTVGGAWRRSVDYTYSPSVPRTGKPGHYVYETWFSTKLCREK